MRPLARLVLYGQAVYYVVTGAWPLLSLTTFQAVTGEKTDLWLVQMVGTLAMAIGVSLGVAARGGRRAPETLVLSIASALAFATIDLLYAGRLSVVYYADAAVEILIVMAVALSWRYRMPA